MNKLENIGAPKEIGEFQLGQITIIGGETELENEAKKASLIKITPLSTCSGKEMRVFERRIRELEISKEKIFEALYEIKDDLREIEKREIITQFNINSKAITELENSDKKIATELKGKMNTLRYQLSKPMIKQRVYEVKKGDKMKENYFKGFSKEDYGESYKKIDSRENGALRQKDIVSLYYSGKLGQMVKIKVPDKVEFYTTPKGEIKERKIKGGIYHEFRPLKDSSEDAPENEIIPGIKSFLENLPGKLVVQIRDKTFPLEKFERKSFSLNDRSKEEVSFLLNLKGDPISLLPCSYYEEPENDWEESWKELQALSYNYIDYEKNHVVVIASKMTLSHIERKLEKLHKEYYFFKNEEGQWAYGLRGLSKYEESYEKKYKKEYTPIEIGEEKFRMKSNSDFDTSEVDELLECLQEIDGCLEDLDGRQSIRNMEYDIRNHPGIKYIFSKNSNELYFLKTALEDVKPFGAEVLTEEEDVLLTQVMNWRIKRHFSQKKITALLNVITGLHLRYEEEEDFGKYLSDELDEMEKVEHERDSKHYKKHRNYYSQTEGILAPNGTPETHKRRSNPPSMETIRLLRRKNGYSAQAGTKYSGISDSKKLVEIYKGGGNNYSFSTRKLLGVDFFTPQDTINSILEEVMYFKHFPKEVRKEYFLANEKCRAPQFRVPSYPVDIMKIILKDKDALMSKELLHPKVYLIKSKLKMLEERRREDENKRNGVWRAPSYPSTFNPGYKYKPGEIKEETKVSTGPLSKDGLKNKIFLEVDGEEKVVYTYGNLEALKYPAIAIAGTRYEPSKKTQKFIRDQVDKYSDEYVIVSGLATGVDTIAHRRCLVNDGITIAVIPSGWMNLAPSKNEQLMKNIVKKGGLIISEHKPHKGIDSNSQYVSRNRIIASLAEKVIICEGGRGTAHTKRFAKEQNKELIIQPNLG